MKFDIYNRTSKQNESGLFADSPQMLRQLYAMNGEEIDILNTVNENPENDLGIATTTPPPLINKIENLNPPLPPPIRLIKETEDRPRLESPGVSIKMLDVDEWRPIQERFFTDNGIEYKINEEGSFKKSWVDVDPKLFRVINIENSKEDKMKSKKIQTLDWVKIR